MRQEIVTGARWRFAPALAVVASTALLAPHPARGVDVFLSWTTPPFASGYRVYQGPQAQSYSSNQDAGALTTDTVDGIVHSLVTGIPTETTRFFAVTAYNEAGESPYSNERQVVMGIGTPPVVSAGPDLLGVLGQVLAMGALPLPNVSYFWFQSSGPPVALHDRTTSRASFRADAAGGFEFVVAAYDGNRLASSDRVTVVVQLASTPPVQTPTVSPQPSPTPIPSLTRTRTAPPVHTPTASPQPSQTATPTSTPTHTAPTSSPTPTPTPPLAPTATSDPATAFCEGPDSAWPVTVVVLVKAVGIALETQPLTECPAVDLDGNRRVTVDELITLVGMALDAGTG